jgi:hypothetical protein
MGYGLPNGKPDMLLRMAVPLLGSSHEPKRI